MNFSQWTVWLANLDPIVGSEQGRTRPVLIKKYAGYPQITPITQIER